MSRSEDVDTGCSGGEGGSAGGIKRCKRKFEKDRGIEGLSRLWWSLRDLAGGFRSSPCLVNKRVCLILRNNVAKT